VGARLQEEAQRWEWDRVGAQRDAWLGEQVASLAEVIFKCANALHAADLPAAALQRDVFVPRLGVTRSA